MAKKKIDGPAIWRPPGFDSKKSHALQAVMMGVADEGAQKAAIEYIIDDLCGMSSQPEDLESENATYYNLGRQVVGRGILHIGNLNLGKMTEMEKNQ